MLDSLKQGIEVANPAAWKNGQVTVNLLSAVIMAALNLGAYKWPILSHIPADTVNAVAAAILGLYNAFVTVASSEKVGIK